MILTTGRHWRWRKSAAFALAAIGVLALAACGRPDEREKPASQVAAKVNKEEISVHQVNFVLQQQRGLKPEQSEQMGHQALERLIDQELAVQRAAELKVDRDPLVLRQMEAARREIIARAYANYLTQGTVKPTPSEVSDYYASKPALFKERRIYNFREVAIDASKQQVETLQRQLADAQRGEEFIDYLKSNGIRFSVTEATRAAEQLPLASLDALARMKEGESLFTATPNGALVLFLVGSRSQPVDEERARPAIEQFLLNERKRTMIEEDAKRLRAGAKIEYIGQFAKAGDEAFQAEGGGAVIGAAPVVPAVAPVPQSSAASGALDNAAITTGMGLKR